MAKDPALLFYTSDFLTETFFMTNEEKGQYITLICLQHQFGYLSKNDLLRVGNPTSEKVLEKFTEIDGKFYNLKTKEEAERRRAYSESRKKNRQSTDNQSKRKNISKSYEKHMETETETETETGTITKANIKKEVEIPFSEFFIPYWQKWKEYKSKEHKFKYKSEHSEKSALNDLLKLSNSNEQTAIQIIEQSIANGWKGFFQLKSNGKTSPRNAGAYQLLEQLKSEHLGTSSNFQ